MHHMLRYDIFSFIWQYLRAISCGDTADSISKLWLNLRSTKFSLMQPYISRVKHVAATNAWMLSVNPRLSMGSAKFVAWLCLWRWSNLDSQSCFVGLGLAKALATIEKTIATTKRAETRTKPPRRMTRMTNRGPLKCLWAASVAKLVTASRLSLMRSSPSLHGQQRHGANLTK